MAVGQLLVADRQHLIIGSPRRTVRHTSSLAKQLDGWSATNSHPLGPSLTTTRKPSPRFSAHGGGMREEQSDWQLPRALSRPPRAPMHHAQVMPQCLLPLLLQLTLPCAHLVPRYVQSVMALGRYASARTLRTHPRHPPFMATCCATHMRWPSSGLLSSVALLRRVRPERFLGMTRKCTGA